TRRRLRASYSRDEAAFGEHRARGPRRPRDGGSGLRHGRPLWRPRRASRLLGWSPRPSPGLSSFPSPRPRVRRRHALPRVSVLVGLPGVLLPSDRHSARATRLHPAAARGAAVLVLLPERGRLLPERAELS